MPFVVLQLSFLRFIIAKCQLCLLAFPFANFLGEDDILRRFEQVLEPVFESIDLGGQRFGVLPVGVGLFAQVFVGAGSLVVFLEDPFHVDVGGVEGRRGKGGG